MMLRGVIAVALALAVGGASAAFAQSRPSAAPYKVGVLLPLTGSGASFGEDGSIGLKVAVSEINSHGGILGRPVEIVMKDDAGDAATAAKAALQLVQEDKVEAILGPVFSGTSAAVLPITNDAKIIEMAASYLADEGNATKYPYVFKINPTAASVGAAFPAYIKKLKLKNAAILNVDNLQGNGVADGVVAGLKAMNIPLTARVSFASGATDLSPQLDQLHRGDPAALVLAMAYGPDYVAALKGLKQIGWNDVVPMGTSAITFDVVVKSAPPDVLAHAYGSGGYRNLTVECEPANVKAFAKAVSDSQYKGGAIPRSIDFMGGMYDALMMVRDAMSATKSTSASAIKTYLESKPHPGVVGTYVYTKERHNGLRDEDFVFVKASAPKNGLSEMAPGQSCK